MEVCLFSLSALFCELIAILDQTATAFWSVLLVPQYSIIESVIEYINVRIQH